MNRREFAFAFDAVRAHEGAYGIIAKATTRERPAAEGSQHTRHEMLGSERTAPSSGALRRAAAPLARLESRAATTARARAHGGGGRPTLQRTRAAPPPPRCQALLLAMSQRRTCRARRQGGRQARVPTRHPARHRAHVAHAHLASAFQYTAKSHWASEAGGGAKRPRCSLDPARRTRQNVQKRTWLLYLFAQQAVCAIAAVKCSEEAVQCKLGKQARTRGPGPTAKYPSAAASGGSRLTTQQAEGKCLYLIGRDERRQGALTHKHKAAPLRKPAGAAQDRGTDAPCTCTQPTAHTGNHGPAGNVQPAVGRRLLGVDWATHVRAVRR